MNGNNRPTISGKRVLVTGGAGFIGSHIADALVTDNDVVVVDDLSSGTRTNVPDGAEFVEGDIRDRSLLRDVMDGTDLVFHQAAIVSVEESVENPEWVQAVNAQGTLQLLEVARAKSARVVVASSAAVYGHPESVPIQETDRKAPTSPYGLSKLTADQYVRLYAELYGLEAIALRYFNVYGPRQTGGDYSGVISIFLDQARSGGPLTVHGDGSQTRDFVHIQDVVQANLLAADHGVAGHAYNVGSGKSTSVRSLAEMIRDTVGKKQEIEIEHQKGRKGDIQKSRAAIDRATMELGFNPTVGLRDGITGLR